MRHIIVVAIGLAIGVAVCPVARYAFDRMRGSRYPGTGQQAGSLYMLGTGLQVAHGPYNYHAQYGRWPESLTAVIDAGLLTTETLYSYPRSMDLPDRRDIKKMKDFDDWIYIKPVDGTPAGPMILAPRPYTSSMGKALSKSKRIVIYSDMRAERVNDDTLVLVLRKHAEN